jgi:hypothetical protein
MAVAETRYSDEFVVKSIHFHANLALDGCRGWRCTALRGVMGHLISILANIFFVIPSVFPTVLVACTDSVAVSVVECLNLCLFLCRCAGSGRTLLRACCIRGQLLIVDCSAPVGGR